MPTGLYFLIYFLHLYPASRLERHNLFGPFHDVITECDCVGTEAIMICFMYAFFERVSRNMSYFVWIVICCLI
jgi:branched-subunit amino acid permease